jgi:hypothetical protein
MCLASPQLGSSSLEKAMRGKAIRKGKERQGMARRIKAPREAKARRCKSPRQGKAVLGKTPRHSNARQLGKARRCELRRGT